MHLAIEISQCDFVTDAISCKLIPCYIHDNYPTQGVVIVIFLGQFCPRGKGATGLTLFI